MHPIAVGLFEEPGELRLAHLAGRYGEILVADPAQTRQVIFDAHVVWGIGDHKLRFLPFHQDAIGLLLKGEDAPFGPSEPGSGIITMAQYQLMGLIYAFQTAIGKGEDVLSRHNIKRAPYRARSPRLFDF